MLLGGNRHSYPKDVVFEHSSRAPDHFGSVCNQMQQRRCNAERRGDPDRRGRRPSSTVASQLEVRVTDNAWT